MEAKYIVQSIIEPNAVITEGFAAHAIEAGGKSHFGVLLSTGRTVRLGVAGGQVVEIPEDKITKHETLPVSPMPPMGSLLSPQDVADITKFLLTQNAAAPAAGRPEVSIAPTALPQGEGFHFTQRPDRLVIAHSGKRAAEFVFRDTKIPRPYFAHVHAPDGTQLTRTYPPVKSVDAVDHDTLHPGLWLAFGDLNGVDFWRNKGRIEHVRFVREPKTDAGRLTFAVEEKYFTADGAEICRGLSEFAFVAGDTLQPALPGTLLLWSTTLRRADGPLTFGPQHEMGLGIRMATPLVVKGGTGSITSSHGGTDEAGNWGRTATWWNYAGTVKIRHAGILAVAAPDNARPVWSHARDYGFLALNPTGPPPGAKDVPSIPFTIPAGESLRLKFGLLLHSGTQPLDAVKAATTVATELTDWKPEAMFQKPLPPKPSTGVIEVYEYDANGNRPPHSPTPIPVLTVSGAAVAKANSS